jgi:hypothetical protein
VSGGLPPGEAQATAAAVRVQVVFHVSDDRQAQAVAERMVDRAHEIANAPDCECDVDVSVERMPAAEAGRVDSGAAPPKI